MFSDVFRKSYHLCDNVGKRITAGEAEDGKIIRNTRIACWIPEATNTHSEYVMPIASTPGDRGSTVVNPLTPNDLYMSRTAPLTSKRSILYIYSTNIGTEYFNPYPANVENMVSS